jgi:hypothetical protein
MSKLEQSAKTAQDTASLLSNLAQDQKGKGNHVGYKSNKEDAASWQKLADHLKGGNFKAAVNHYDAMPDTVKDHAKDLDDGKLHTHLTSALKEMVELVEVFEGLGLSEDTGLKMLSMLESAQASAYQEGFDDAREQTKSDIEKIVEAAEAYGECLVDSGDSYGDLIKEAAEAYVAKYTETLKEAAETYAEKAVSEFVEKNEEKFVQTNQFERMQNVFSMMKESFEMNGFELNENKKADSLKEALDEVTSQYDEIFSELKESRDQLETVSKALLVEQAFSNLTETQKEKANSLLEGLTFNSSEDFEKGLESIVESVSKKAEKSVDLLNEETQGLKNSNTTDLTKYRGLL